VAYPNDMRGLLQQTRDTLNTGNASTSQYPDTVYGLLQNIRDLLNTGNASTGQYPKDITGLLTNVRDLLNTGNASVAKYSQDQLGLWLAIRDFSNTDAASVTQYPPGIHGAIQALKDIVVGGGGGGTATLRSIATRSQVPATFSATNKQFMSRSRHICRTAVTQLKIAVANFYGSNTDAAPGADATYTASIEYPAGTFTQVTFSGSATGTVTNGDYLLSDFVNVTIPQDADFYVRLFYNNTAGMTYCGQSPQDAANGDFFAFAPSGLTDQTMGGTITSSGGLNAAYPAAIVGVSNKPVVALIGDSRCYGQADTYVGTSGNRGEIAPSIAPSLATLSVATPSDRTISWVTNHPKRLALVKAYATHAVVQLGINDLGSNATAAQVQTSNLAIGTAIALPTWYCTVAPKTTSTDSFATLANQTIFAQDAARVTYNNAVRAGLPSASGFFEIADPVESSRDSGKWMVNGTANFATTDGLHENHPANAAITSSGNINPAVFT
jgi:hypothetical protein